MEVVNYSDCCAAMTGCRDAGSLCGCALSAFPTASADMLHQCQGQQSPAPVLLHSTLLVVEDGGADIVASRPKQEGSNVAAAAAAANGATPRRSTARLDQRPALTSQLSIRGSPCCSPARPAGQHALAVELLLFNTVGSAPDNRASCSASPHQPTIGGQASRLATCRRRWSP